MRLLFIFLLCFVSLSCAKGRENNKLEEAKNYFQKAKESFFEKSNFEDAEKNLRELTRLVPTFEPISLNFMQGYLNEKEHLYEKAIKKYLRELKISQEDPKIIEFTLLNLAQTYFKAGIFYKALFNSSLNAHINYYNCRLYLNKAKTINLEHKGLVLKKANLDYLLYFRGICYYLSEEFQKAINDFNKIKSKPLYWSALIRLGACYYKKGLIQKANWCWDTVYKNNKNNLEVLSELGYIYAQLDISEKLEEALRYCQKAFEEIKTERIAKCLIWVYFKNNQVNEAIKLLEKINFKNPDLVDKLGEYKDLKQGIEIEYTTKFYDPSILDHKANIYLNQAIKYYKRYLRHNPENEVVNCQIGISQLNSNQLNEAIELFNKLLTSSKRENVKLKAKINLGTAYYLKGDKLKAEQLWDDVNKGSDNPLARNDLGATYAKLGIKLEQAVSLCQVEEAEKPGIASWNLGKVYFKKGITQSNTDYLSRAIMYYEKNHVQESGYSIKMNDPLLLLDLATAYYNRHLFRTASEITASLQHHYPEAKQGFDSFQAVAEIWQVIKWDEGLAWKIEWQDI